MSCVVEPEFQVVCMPGRGKLLRKRLFDVICSACGLIVLSPVFLLCALAVKLSSPGEILFRQERIGLGGKSFIIYKFRTMRVDNDGLRITTAGDSRITKAGRILRKTKLDEIPQLWNVLRGDMSIVGPRPEVREYTQLYTQEQQQIHKVRPGITSIASIRYRNENEILSSSPDPNETYIKEIMPEKIALDLGYIPKASVCYDIMLIIETLGVVLRK